MDKTLLKKVAAGYFTNLSTSEAIEYLRLEFSTRSAKHPDSLHLAYDIWYDSGKNPLITDYIFNHMEKEGLTGSSPSFVEGFLSEYLSDHWKDLGKSIITRYFSDIAQVLFSPSAVGYRLRFKPEYTLLKNMRFRSMESRRLALIYPEGSVLGLFIFPNINSLTFSAKVSIGLGGANHEYLHLFDPYSFAKRSCRDLIDDFPNVIEDYCKKVREIIP